MVHWVPVAGRRYIWTEASKNSIYCYMTFFVVGGIGGKDVTVVDAVVVVVAVVVGDGGVLV